jgi:aliphatic nitrilase
MKTAAPGLTQTPGHDLNHHTVPTHLTLRVKALESLLVEKGLVDPAGLDALIDGYEKEVSPRDGAQVGVHPKLDPASKQRLSCFKAAAVHAAPVYLNREATLDKACDFIREAARHGAQFIAFPESFLPGFPIWAALWAPIENHGFFRQMVANSILVDGQEMQQLQQAARTEDVFVSMGFSERNPASVGGIWNSNVLISDEGILLNHHRKIVPTFYEKLIWSNGDGHGLKVIETRLGKIGALICGENTNPLARYTLIAQSEEIHVSSWPPVWPTQKPLGANENYDLAAAVRIRASAHSFEAKAFGVVSSGFLDKKTREVLVERDQAVAEILDNTPRSVSMFVAPTGGLVGEVLQDEEGILYADIDVSECVEPKQFHDLSGGYNRFDIFELRVNRTRLQPYSVCGD